MKIKVNENLNAGEKEDGGVKNESGQCERLIIDLD